jgi:hypothetical protein
VVFRSARAIAWQGLHLPRAPQSDSHDSLAHTAIILICDYILYRLCLFHQLDHIFSRIVVSISACHQTIRRRPGFNSQLESFLFANILLTQMRRQGKERFLFARWVRQSAAALNYRGQPTYQARGSSSKTISSHIYQSCTVLPLPLPITFPSSSPEIAIPSIVPI